MTMKSEVGDKNFPIWLLGDSNPKNWQNVLVSPLDARHPARHSIWTPILDVIQDNVFRKSRSRVDTSSIYIRNAIENPADKPLDSDDWSISLEQINEEFCQHLYKYRPAFVLCFGAFSFEFARRALKQDPKRSFGHWSVKSLGVEFRQRINQFDPNMINILPLLHASISRGRFIDNHKDFTEPEDGNYFEFVGNHIADRLLAHRQHLKIWIE